MGIFCLPECRDILNTDRTCVVSHKLQHRGSTFSERNELLRCLGSVRGSPRRRSKALVLAYHCHEQNTQAYHYHEQNTHASTIMNKTLTLPLHEKHPRVPLSRTNHSRVRLSRTKHSRYHYTKKYSRMSLSRTKHSRVPTDTDSISNRKFVHL